MKDLLKKIPITYFIFTLFFSTNIFFAQETSITEDRPSVALVLSGGGAKGFAHIPVLEVMEELDIPIDMIIGNSAGSIVGALYCAGYSTSEILESLTDLNWAEIFHDAPVSPFESLLGSRGTLSSPISIKLGNNFALETGGGLSAGQNAYMLFKKLTSKIPSYIEFDSLKIPFKAVATNLLTGELEIISKGDLAEAIRSSMSIPAVFQPFPMDGKLYVDGFVRNNTPIQPVAELGYDIIIVVELGEDMEDNAKYLESSAFSTLTQVLTIFMQSANGNQYEQADVVIKPNTDDYSMFDFLKAEEIYQVAADEKDTYRRLLSRVKDLIYKNVETEAPSKKPENTQSSSTTYFSYTPVENKDEPKPSFYSQLPLLQVQELVLNGALESDKEYIYAEFNKFKGKPLTSELLDNFVSAVYSTGNYNLVLPRTDLRQQNPQLELILYKKNKESWVIIPSATFEGTIGENSISKLTFGADIQFRGLTGVGSVLAVKATMINDFAAGLFYMQPLGPHSYIQLSADAKIEQEFITSGFSVSDIQGSRLSYANTGVLFGIRFNQNHRMQTGASIYWIGTEQVSCSCIKEQEAKYPDVDAGIGAPLNIGYTFDNLDYPSFPTKGFYVKVDDTGIFPLFAKNAPIAFNLCRVDFTAAIPLSSKVSIVFNMFAGSDITRQLMKIPSFIPMFGFSLGDRTFFPQFSGKYQHGTHKGAAQLVLQFQPWQNLTILGGQMFISLSGSIGEVAMDYTDFSVEKIQWNTSLNAGIRIGDIFSIMCRFGAGTTSDSISPFLSLDFGTIRY